MLFFVRQSTAVFQAHFTQAHRILHSAQRTVRAGYALGYTIIVFIILTLMYLKRLFPLLLALSFFSWNTPLFADEVRTITFPVDGNYSYRNDWHEPRGGGTRLHIGNDIIADKMTKLVSVVDGYVSYVGRPQDSWGYEITLQDNDGYTYSYLHINNDTPGTDDGVGGESNAYASGVVRGATVSRGQFIGWVGDSGNAETTVPHLHFEIRDANNVVINPYASLYAASGGKGVSSGAPRPTNTDSSEREQLVSLRYIFTKQVGIGAESGEVQHLQRVLRALGFFNHPSNTGYFGEVTAESVRKYQTAKKIPVTGITDALTREKLNDDLGTYDPNLYKPFYSDAEKRAILIQQLLTQIAILQKQLDAIRPR